MSNPYSLRFAQSHVKGRHSSTTAMQRLSLKMLSPRPPSQLAGGMCSILVGPRGEKNLKIKEKTRYEKKGKGLPYLFHPFSFMPPYFVLSCQTSKSWIWIGSLAAVSLARRLVLCSKARFAGSLPMAKSLKRFKDVKLSRSIESEDV